MTDLTSFFQKRLNSAGGPSDQSQPSYVALRRRSINQATCTEEQMKFQPHHTGALDRVLVLVLHVTLTDVSAKAYEETVDVVAAALRKKNRQNSRSGKTKTQSINPLPGCLRSREREREKNTSPRFYCFAFEMGNTFYNRLN